MWDVPARRELARWRAFDTPQRDRLAVSAVAISPDARHVAFAVPGVNAHLWAWETPEPPSELPGPSHALAFSADGQELVTAAGVPTWTERSLRPLSVRRWDVATQTLRSRVDDVPGSDPDVLYLALSDDGRLVATHVLPSAGESDAIAAGTVRVRDTATGAVVATLRPAAGEVDFSRGGARVYAGGVVWDVPSARPLWAAGGGEGFLARDGEQVVSLEVAGSPNPLEWLWPFKKVEPDRRIRVTHLARDRTTSSRTLARGRGRRADTVELLTPSPDRRTFVDTRLRLWRVPD